MDQVTNAIAVIGIYFALMTIAFGQVFWFISIKWHSVTGGEDGLLKIARLPADLGFVQIDLGSSNYSLYYFVLIAFAATQSTQYALITLVYKSGDLAQSRGRSRAASSCHSSPRVSSRGSRRRHRSCSSATAR